MHTIFMVFLVIAHHAHYDHAERISIQPFAPSTIKAAPGIWLTLQNGQKILGAAVSAIGHGNADVTEAIVTQIAYCHPGFYQTDIAQDLSTFLVNSTGGKMQKALLTGSGTFPYSS